MDIFPKIFFSINEFCLLCIIQILTFFQGKKEKAFQNFFFLIYNLIFCFLWLLKHIFKSRKIFLIQHGIIIQQMKTTNKVYHILTPLWIVMFSLARNLLGKDINFNTTTKWAKKYRKTILESKKFFLSYRPFACIFF